MIAELVAGLCTMTLVGSFATLAVLALRGSLRRRFGAQFAYAAWLVVPLSVLATGLPAPARPLGTLLLLPLAAVGIEPAQGAAAVESATDWRAWMLGLWLLGAAICAVYFVMQQRRYLRSLGRLDARGARVVSAEHARGGPALVGAWRPRIVLPSDFSTRYAADERELILTHERVHLARGDTRVNALVALLRCLNWFNPLAHVAAACLRFDQELACDAAVITRFPQARRRYADAMLKTQLAPAAWLPAGCHWSPVHPLKERIAMLKHPLPSRARRVAGHALVLSFGLAAAWAAWAAQMPAAAPSGAADAGPAYARLSPPDYPEAARAAGIEGLVVIAVDVDAHGAVGAASVRSVKPSNATALGDAALAAVKQWSFEPAHDGKGAIASTAQVPVRFSLEGSNAAMAFEAPAGALDVIDVVGQRPAH